MKPFLFLMITSLTIICSCNNAASDDNNNDSSNVGNNEGSNNGSNNNVVSKQGLPLSPKQEVPVNNSSASGTADVSYNKDNQMLTYTINWTGLTDKPVMSHIHGTAPKGANAGVKHDFSGSLPKTASGSFSDSVKVDGVAIKEDSLLGGFYYINIHTPKNPGGEIRGQIEF
ncbi:MAG: hypothetical protein AVDCRST_MAG96-43 [uncultured Segetibacter sp.]|uniref:CHRD domain-containing protein n=1 Tax=uncultured Segetibacter sp. TaxID=481133 RepID=A0A6J4R758_9BACT|nr:MAG: hypothetical protein AVDCRST_MAG96-43 [uncultured Segetibacter sp.]